MNQKLNFQQFKPINVSFHKKSMVFIKQPHNNVPSKTKIKSLASSLRFYTSFKVPPRKKSERLQRTIAIKGSEFLVKEGFIAGGFLKRKGKEYFSKGKQKIKEKGSKAIFSLRRQLPISIRKELPTKNGGIKSISKEIKTEKKPVTISYARKNVPQPTREQVAPQRESIYYGRTDKRIVYEEPNGIKSIAKDVQAEKVSRNGGIKSIASAKKLGVVYRG